jgi:diketogulonate reductase-like aldo/keto reductase
MSTKQTTSAGLRTIAHLDLYLLHWRGSLPLDETVEAFDALRRQGKIRYWGVSNFEVDDMEELVSLPENVGPVVAVNQVLYNLARRGIEYDLLPWCRTRGIPIMAYSPLERGGLAKDKALKAIADRLTATASQVALAWVLRHDGVIAIPKASRFEHVRENRGALELELTPDDIKEIDEAFPPPTRKTPLETI